MRTLIILLLISAPAFAGSKCWAIANIATKADWENPAKWASTSGGSGGTCAAVGGAGLAIYGNTETLPTGVPGTSGAGDFVIVKTGITVHVAAGLGVELGTIATNTAPGVEVNATDATTFGAFIVDSGGLVSLKGNSSTTSPLRKIDRYAVFQVMPGGWVWNHGNTGSVPRDTINGRMYIGCGDQTAYPSPFCASGNAGTWVTPSVSGTLNFTASGSLPAYVAVGDMVELDRVPKQALPYPYTAIDGKTPPPPFPNMPVTNDTGSSPMQTCGTLASCLVPDSQPLCVIAISGTSASLGWPHGGTPAKPYCDGTETAMAVTSTGSGQLWLKKPAYFWGLPDDFTWNTARSTTYSSTLGVFDALRSGASLGFGPVSNAAGTGPGRPGDNSLAISGSNFGAPCAMLRIEDIGQSNQGCFVDYDRAAIFAYGRYFSFTGSATYTTASAPATTTFAGFVTGITTDQTYAEMVFENIDVRYLYQTTGTNSVIAFKATDNTANHRVAFQHGTVRMCGLLLGIGDNTTPLQPDASHPVEVTETAVFAGSHTNAPIGVVGFIGTAQNVDVSRNFFDDWHTSVYCKLVSSTTYSLFTHVTLTHNLAMTESFFGTSVTSGGTDACQWPSALVQQNRVQGGQGQSAPNSAPWAGALLSPHNKDANSRITIQYNFFYGLFRLGQLQSNTDFRYNTIAHNWHHLGVTGQSQNSWAGATWLSFMAFSQNLDIHHNVFLHNDNGAQGIACWELGYDEIGHIDNLKFRNNTCLGMSGGGLALGDVIDSNAATLITGLQAADNIFGTLPQIGTNIGAGLTRSRNNTSTSGPIMMQSHRSFVGYNSMQGTVPMVQGSPTPSVNNIPNPQYNRNILASQGGVNYNTSSTRNVKGVAIQNPTYSSNQTGAALKLVRTSGSDMTLAWALDGVTYGTAAQLNWGGTGTTYTIATVSDPGAVRPQINVTVSGTPFTAMGTTNTVVSTSCPVTRWAIVVSAAGSVPVGTAFAVGGCSGTAGAATGQITLVPRDTRLVTGDVLAVLNSEVRLLDAGGTNYVDVGIDARTLPASSQTDTGISLALTDYCSTAGVCASAPVATGLPTTYTAGVTSAPLIPLAPPWAGGSAEQAFTGTYYIPSGSAWKTASSTGSYIGAIPPPSVAGQWPAWFGSWNGLIVF